MKNITANNLKQFISDNSLTMAQVATLLDIHPGTVAAWCCGQRKMPVNTFKLLQITLIIRSE